MKHRVIWTVISMLILLGLVAGSFGCAEPAAVTTTVTAAAKTVTVTAAAEKPDVINWRLQPFAPTVEQTDHFKDYMLWRWMDQGWADFIENATTGRLKITLVEPNSIYPVPEALENIGNGVIECAYTSVGYHSGTMPECYIGGGPPCTLWGAHLWYDFYHQYGYYDKIEEVYNEYNVTHITAFPQEVSSVITTFPCNSVDDIKGRKIRVFGAMGAFVEAFGGLPVSIAYSELYQAFQLGTIEGAVTGACALEEMKIKEVATGMVSDPNVYASVHAILMNQDAFNALPNDIQGIISDLSKSWMQEGALMVYQNEYKILMNAVKDYGMVTYQWPGEDKMRVAEVGVEQVLPKYAALSPRVAEHAQMLEDFMRLYGMVD